MSYAAALTPVRRRAPGRLYARHRVDISVAQLGAALARCVVCGGAGAQLERIEALTGEALVSLSVRSAFDLLLEALALKPGTLVAVSAVTIPDMVRIIEAHGLKPVPVELDVATLAMRPEALERALGPRTGALLVAHLFGGRMDLGPTFELARRRGVPVIEDCAQGFLGPHDRGDARALASLFSFGTIKTSTALGGAVTHVRDAALLARMRALQARLPLQSRQAYAARVSRFMGLSSVGSPSLFGAMRAAAEALGIDLEARLGSAAKGFPGGPEALLSGIRRRPSAPLLALLAHRLERFDARRLAARAENGERLRAVLDERMPGRAQPVRTHWLLPFVSEAPGEVIASLRANGFDAAQGTTSLTALGGCAPWLSRVVYLPAYPELPPSALERLIALVT
ncbi:MAG: DegT/DnrJ/EryC1/StrS family aminotransferase [Archangiaceae bacterium]|nr:DegT/DnrJ/EryC1/StrS family aminotransferase [Archangiaceae bacterium]